MIEYDFDEKNGLMVTIKGEIDHHTAATIRQQTDELIFKYTPKKLTLPTRSINLEQDYFPEP